MDRDRSRLYPNESSAGPREGRLSRRTLLGTSAAIGTAVTTGCVGDGDTPAEDADDGGDGGDGGDGEGDEPATAAEPTVYVSNTGEGTVSLIDVASTEVVDTVDVGFNFSFPSNQFTPRLTAAAADPLWLNVGQGVRAIAAGTFEQRASVDTGSGANWQELTPDGSHLVVSAREPSHTQYRVDADPDSDDFGRVTAEIDRTPEGGRGSNDGPGPCDVTVHPDGEFAYVPDLFGDTLTVLDVEGFEIHRQIAVEPASSAPPEPWMGTAAWDGETLLVEHNEGVAGSESIWDISDPGNPVERCRLTTDDGMGEGPLTSEIGPDSAFGYVFTPGTNDVTVVDLASCVVETRLDLGGEAFAGTWGPDGETLFVPVQTADEVAVIDANSRDITARVPVGSEPYGATAARLRPADPGVAARRVRTPLQHLRAEETTYCIGRCACGHEF